MDRPTPQSKRLLRSQDLSVSPADAQPGDIACPSCGYPMHGIKGSRRAICPNCGFKDACCY